MRIEFRRPRRVALAGLLAMGVAPVQVGPIVRPHVDSPISGHPRPTHIVDFTANEGTFASADVAPDGESIVFDLLGQLYVVPIDGGRATRITADNAWYSEPRYAPNGKRIVVVSDRSGSTNLWLIDEHGRRPRQLTWDTAAVYYAPAWSSDGSRILARRRSTSHPQQSMLITVPITGGRSRILIADAAAGDPSPAPDGNAIYVDDDSLVERIYPRGHAVPLLAGPANCGWRPRLLNAGETLIVACKFGQQLGLLEEDVRSGRRRIIAPSIATYFGPVGNGQEILPNYGVTPDDSSVVAFSHGRLVRIRINDAKEAIIPFEARVQWSIPAVPEPRYELGLRDIRARSIQYGRFSPDQRMVAATAAGRIYLLDRRTMQLRRLTTSSNETVEISPAFSPDGKRLAYISWRTPCYSELHVAAIDESSDTVVISGSQRLLNPAWDRDGTRLTFTEADCDRPGRPSVTCRVSWIDLSAPQAVHIIALASRSHDDRRLFTQPTFDPNGDAVLFALHNRASSELRRVPVDGAEGTTEWRGPPSAELVLGPDGRTLAVSAKGEIRVYQIGGSMPRTAGVAEGRIVAREPGIGFLQWANAHVITWCVGSVCRSRDLRGSSPIDSVRIAVPLQPLTSTDTFALVHARIITMDDDSLIDDGTVVVRGDRIGAVGPSALIDVSRITTIDLHGQTVMPGLIDVHAHVYAGPPESMDRAYAKLRAFKSFGVTTAFDPQASSLSVFALADMIQAGRIDGPRLLSTGDPVYGEEGYNDEFGSITSPLGTSRDALDVARERKAAGALMLKVYAQTRRNRRQWLADAAASVGVGITAEGACDLALDLSFVRDGYPSFEHSFPVEVFSDVATLMAKAGTVYTPTLSAGCGGSETRTTFSAMMTHEDSARLGPFATQIAKPARTNADVALTRLAKNAATIQRFGGAIAIGAHGEDPGVGTLWEARALGRAGIDPQSVLAALTIVGARKLGIDHDLGSISPGKIADLVVFTNNPLARLDALHAPTLVVVNGVVERF